MGVSQEETSRTSCVLKLFENPSPPACVRHQGDFHHSECADCAREEFGYTTRVVSVCEDPVVLCDLDPDHPLGQVRRRDFEGSTLIRPRRVYGAVVRVGDLDDHVAQVGAGAVSDQEHLAVEWDGREQVNASAGRGEGDPLRQVIGVECSTIVGADAPGIVGDAVVRVDRLHDAVGAGDATGDQERVHVEAGRSIAGRGRVWRDIDGNEQQQTDDAETTNERSHVTNLLEVEL